MTNNQIYWTSLIVSVVVAYLGWSSPSYRMPLDYDAMISRSVPFALAWALIFGFCLWRYQRHGLWLLVGTPMAVYWPIWLLFNHFPPCYYSGNCV